LLSLPLTEHLSIPNTKVGPMEVLFRQVIHILIVLLSVIGIILEEMKTNVIPINPTIIRVMRVLRIARGLYLLKIRKRLLLIVQSIKNTVKPV
jgi:voltage-dependent calcium channel T type alpha-1G